MSSSTSNLSELSFQLRKLQSSNNAQEAEIDRLERQLRILSELKGVSLSRLNDALRAACEGEAHGELRSVVGKLKAELDGVEAAALVGGRADRREGAAATGGATKTAEGFNEEAARRARTNLELRVGELEELLSASRTELDALYDRGSERVAELSAENAQLRSRLDRAEAEARARDERDAARAGGLVPATPTTPAGQPSTGAYDYSEFAVASSINGSNGGDGRRAGPPTPPPPRLLHNAPQTQVDAEAERRLVVAETGLVSEKEKSDLLRIQLDSSRKAYGLKIDQYEHRIQFLERQL